MFELSVSSKFASSDAVNWLPVAQSDYVVASVLSVSYNYSVIPSILVASTLGPSYLLGLGAEWDLVALMSLFGLIMGGALVEILRAAVNRVTSAVMGRARRGALVLRLVIFVIVILVFELVFNPILLISFVDAFSKTLSTVVLIPLFWASAAVSELARGDVLASAALSVASFLFTAFLLFVAVMVRARYWSPSPYTVVVTHSEYTPREGFLMRLGLTSAEAAIVRKDMKGLVRRRELIQFFSLPVVFTVLLVIGPILSPGSGLGGVTDIPLWFLIGIFAMLISSSSFGQEGRALASLYALPVTPSEILRAKSFLALVFTLTAAMAIFLVVSIVDRVSPLALAENLLITIAITVEAVFIGLEFGARYPDIQDRPRPRFVDPVGILIMMIVGVIIIFITALPAIAIEILSVIPGSSAPSGYLLAASIVFAGLITALFYRWTSRAVKKLFSEFMV